MSTGIDRFKDEKTINKIYKSISEFTPSLSKSSIDTRTLQSFLELRKTQETIFSYVFTSNSSKRNVEHFVNSLTEDAIEYIKSEGGEAGLYNSHMLKNFFQSMILHLREKRESLFNRQENAQLATIQDTMIGIKDEIVEKIENSLSQSNEVVNEEFIDESLKNSILSLGTRYTPKLNFETETARIFDPLFHDEFFINEFNQAFVDLKKIVERYGEKENDEYLAGYKSEFLHAFNELKGKYLVKQISRNERYDFKSLQKLASIAEEKCDICYEYLFKKKIKNEQVSENNMSYFRSCLVAFRKLIRFTEHSRVGLWNSPYLIVSGEAGIGKSHLLADIAVKKRNDGHLVLLLLGNHFRTEENPLNQLMDNIMINKNPDEFLSELNIKAANAGKRALILIDGLNEGSGRYFWNDYLIGFINKIKKYKNIALVLSVRSTYEDVIIPNQINQDRDIVKITHEGFANVEYEASKLFFKNFNIELPSVPLLQPEFKNPLFLKVFCEGLKIQGKTRIPEGYEGIVSILNFYIDGLNKKISKDRRFEYDSSFQLVRQSLNKLIEYKIQNNKSSILYTEAFNLVGDFVKIYTSGYRQYLQILIDEGILIKEINYNKEEIISISYERFEDILTAKYLLDNYIKKHDHPAIAFQKGNYLNEFVKDERSISINNGVIESFAILLPETIDLEIYEVVSEELKGNHNIRDAFIKSLLWRKSDSIDERILDYINQYIRRYKYSSQLFYDTLIQITGRPNHLFNADFLHKNLLNYSLARRDADWTIYISENFKSTSIQRIIDWAWAKDDKSYVSNESINLMATMITWFLTSTNRELRDSSTKALVCLFKDRMSVVIDVLRKFEKVNDPYVYERLYAAVYGATLRTNQKEYNGELSHYVYETIFLQSPVYEHILLRDYARGIVENALKNKMASDIDVEKIRPPYNSPWYESTPTNEEIDKYKVDYESEEFRDIDWSLSEIISSMTTEYGRGTGGYGDFGRYVFGSAVSEWDNYFDDQDLSNIATKRIFDMGYDVELHGEFDRQRSPSFDRSNVKIERIGKKYQWIAFHELLAKLTDNFIRYEENNVYTEEYNEKVKNRLELFRRKIVEDKPDSIQIPIVAKTEEKDIVKVEKEYTPYNGPWNPFVRDIDPTLLSKEIVGENNYFEQFYKLPDVTTIEWVDCEKSLPEINELGIIEFNSKHYVTLGGYSKWVKKVLEEQKHSERDEVFIKLSGKFVPSNEKGVNSTYLKNGIESWPSTYSIFAFEFYDHESITNYFSEYVTNQDNVNTVPAVHDYSWEKQSDHSIEGSVSYLMPSGPLVKKLKLTQVDEGFWYDESGKLVSFDLALLGYKPWMGIEKESLEEFLNQNNYSLYWDVYIEKVGCGHFHEWRRIYKWDKGEIIEVNQYDEQSGQLRRW